MAATGVLTLLLLLPLILANPLPQRLILGGSRQRRSGRYLVVFKKTVAPPVQDILESIAGNGGLVNILQDQVYEVGQFKGFSVPLSYNQRISLENDPRVAYVEEDAWATTQQQGWVAQNGVPWGLARISHRATGNTTYLYNDAAGAGACVYTIDTGIDVGNPEFEGRATFVKSFVEGAQTDDHGHGTHVAGKYRAQAVYTASDLLGTIGSRTFGVAKRANIYAVKVLNATGGGYWSNVISGVNFAVADSKQRFCPKGVVMNLSLGGRKSQAVNDAVAAAVNAGIFVSVAAGNSGVNIANTSPASEIRAFSVAASDVNDKLAAFSNYGQALSIIAPGVDIVSTWKNGNTATLSGTSMASPYIAGMAAYMMSIHGPTSPGSVGARIRSYSTRNAVDFASWDRSMTPNMLAFNGAPL